MSDEENNQPENEPIDIDVPDSDRDISTYEEKQLIPDTEEQEKKIK